MRVKHVHFQMDASEIGELENMCEPRNEHQLDELKFKNEGLAKASKS